MNQPPVSNPPVVQSNKVTRVDTAVTTAAPSSDVLAKIINNGDLSKLTEVQRAQYYLEICNTLGLSPHLKPFDYLTLQGRMVLYATKNCTDQLRRLHNVSVFVVERKVENDILIVTARAKMPDGREDECIGALNIKGLAGDALANAYMKCDTKAKRRVTLAICGLGWLDESETHSVPSIQYQSREPVAVRDVTPPLPQPAPAQKPAPTPPPAKPREPDVFDEIDDTKKKWAASSASKVPVKANAPAVEVSKKPEVPGDDVPW